MKNHNVTRFRWIPKDELLKRIRKSVSDFTSVFVNLELDHEHPPADPADLDPAVTAVIGFSGAYQGAVWAHCTEPLAVRIAAGMWGRESDGIDHDVRHALSEMVNILGEDIRLFLSPRGHDVVLSLPSVYHGEELCDPDYMVNPESLFCSFHHQGERLLVGMMVKKSL